MGQLSISTNGKPQVTLPIYSPEEITRIEQRFNAYAAHCRMDAALMARDMIFALDALGLSPNPLTAECQIAGLLVFAFGIVGTERPGKLAGYLPAYSFDVDLAIDHRAERITWHVEAESERPN